MCQHYLDLFSLLPKELWIITRVINNSAWRRRAWWTPRDGNWDKRPLLAEFCSRISRWRRVKPHDDKLCRSGLRFSNNFREKMFTSLVFDGFFRTIALIRIRDSYQRNHTHLQSLRTRGQQERDKRGARRQLVARRQVFLSEGYGAINNPLYTAQVNRACATKCIVR